MTHPSRARTRVALVVLVAAQFVVMLDTSIVNVALPSIQSDLGIAHTGIAWVVNTYFLAFGGFLLVAGRLADAVGRRRMLMLGAGLFTAASLLAGFASSEAMLLVARVLQGIGAASLSPAALSILLVMFPGPSRAKAMSAWGAASTLGGATGVLVGGVATGLLGWPSVFFVTVPLSAALVVAAPLLFPAAEGNGGARFDFAGAAAVTGAALGLIFAALSVPASGLVSLPVLGGLGWAGASLIAFVLIERRAADPILPLALFRAPAVSVGVAVGVLGGAARASSFFLVALFLQQVLLLDPELAGLGMVPTSLAGFAVSVLLLPRVLRALAPETVVLIGLLVLAAGHLWLARSPLGPSYFADVLPALLLIAAGVALSFTPSTMVIASGVPAERSGLASGLSNASSQIGAAIGIAMLGAIVAAGAAGSAAGPADLLDGFRGAFGTAAGLALVAAAITSSLVLRRRGPKAVPAATPSAGMEPTPKR
ncbi:MFS transporter [Lysobacter korlensis]|uniref:MFS transporter n=1 Tax=Lysobacter korlensis TaxID=553636 RepID=A0ABV6RNZ9_9GAMM